MKTIRLYGPLAKFVGQRELKAEVRSPAEAVRFLIVNFPGVHEHMAEQFYCVKAGSYMLKDESQLHHPVGSTEEIKIVPVVQGASGVGKILAGIGLLVASVFIPGGAAFLGIGLKGLAFSIGASLTLGGVAEVLAPTPKSFNRDERDPTASRIFSGVANVSRAGIPLPVVYGETTVGSIAVSLGVRALRDNNEDDEEGGSRLTGAYTQSGLESGPYEEATKSSMTDGRHKEKKATVATQDGDSNSWVMMEFGKPKRFSKVVIGCDFDETLSDGVTTWGKTFAEGADIEVGYQYPPDSFVTWEKVGETGTFTEPIQTYDVDLSALAGDATYGGQKFLRVIKNGAKLAITEFYAIQLADDFGELGDENETPELESTAYARIIDVLSEGGIEGFPSARKEAEDSAEYDLAALKDIYLDNTPILAPGADVGDLKGRDYNFQDVTVKYRRGTIGQSTVPSGFRLIEAEQSVEAQVTKDQSVTREITNVNVNQVRVTVTSPAMRKVDGANIKAARYTIEISVAYGTGGYTAVLTRTIRNLSDGPYQWSYKFDIDPAGDFPVRVRLRRTADDPGQDTADSIQNDSIWTSYTEITKVKCAYPGSAYVALDVSAEQFSNIPSRRYRIRGRRIFIPSNATIKPKNGRLVYSGTWDGTFSAERVWCACPAWILWDLLTSDRYGLGDHIKEENLDKWEFYAASVYANEKVDNGFGAQEPRFSCNVSIQTEADAYAAINELSGVMRAMPIWSLGGLSLSQERPRSVVIGFDEDTVEDGVFNYSGSSGKTRANVVVVGWFNRDTAEIEYEEVIDEASVAKYGAVKKDITAFACTSRGQAYRLGKWMIASEQQEAQVVTFTTDLRSGIQIRPGDVFTTQDPVHGNVSEQWKLLTIKETAPEKYEVTGVYYNPSKFTNIDTGIKFSDRTLANTIDPTEED